MNNQVYSQESELSVLRHIAKESSIRIISMLDSNWFYYEPYRKVIEFWKANPDKINIEETRETLGNIVESIFIPVNGDVHDSLTVVERKYNQRQIDIKIDEIKRIVYFSNPQDVILELNSYFSNLGINKTKVRTIKEGFFDEDHSLIDFGTKRPALNELLLSKGSILVVGGDSGHHKTNQLIDLLFTALEANIVNDKNFKVLMFSKEMTHKEVSQRMLAKKFKIPLKDVKRRNFDIDKVMSRLANEFPYLLTNFLVIAPEQFRNSSDMARFLLEHRPVVWGLDYLQYTAQMMAGNKAQEQNVNVMELTATSKLLVQMTDSLGIILSQLRKKEQGRLLQFPVIDDLEWSGLIKQLAHNICMVFWPWNVNGELQQHVHICSWQKTRDAKKFNEFLRVEPEFCNFEAMPRSEALGYQKYVEL